MKIAVYIMKFIRRSITPITEWYRHTAFLSGLKSYDGVIGIKGSVYLWNDNVSIGGGTNVYQGVMLWGRGSITIGHNVEIGFNSTLYANKKIVIGDNCLIAAGCYIIDSNHGIGKDDLIRNQSAVIKGPVVLKDDVWLGAGVKVLSGVTIGKGAVIGAQSLVNCDIPENAIAVGIPAKVIGYRK